MKTAVHADLLAALSDILDLTPDMRLGQLVALMGDFGQMEYEYPLAELEDDQLLAVLQNHHANLIAHGFTPARQAHSESLPLLSEHV